MSQSGFPRCVLVDANFLVAWVSPKTSKDDRARLEFFFSTAEKAKSRIVIPMPAIAEYLVQADAAGLATLAKLERKAFVFLAPFDRAAAMECALLDRTAFDAGGGKKDGVDQPWQKIKVDRQLVAIGKSLGASLFITGDIGLRKISSRAGITAKSVGDLELPDSARQIILEFAGKNLPKQISATEIQQI